MIKRFSNSMFMDGMAQSLLNQFLVSGFNFAVGIAAARILGITEFGLFSLIFMLSQFLSVAESYFLTTPMMTICGAKPNLSKRYFGSVFTLACSFALISSVITAILIAAYFAVKSTPPPPGIIAASALFTFAQNLQIVVRRILFVRKRFTAGVSMEFIKPLILAALVLVWLGAGFSANLVALFILLGVSTLIPVAIAALKYLDVRGDRRMAKALLAKHWPMSRWFLFILLVSICQEQAIWVMVGVNIGDAGVGALRAGQYLLGMTHVLVLSLENFLPRSAAEKLRTGDASALGNYLFRQFVIIGGMSLAIISVLFVYSGEILSLVFGEAYSQYSNLLRLFSIVYFVVLVRGMFEHYLRAIEDVRAIFFAFLASAITAIITIIPLLSGFGVEGAIYCMMLAQSVCLAGVVYFASRHFNRPDQTIDRQSGVLI